MNNAEMISTWISAASIATAAIVSIVNLIVTASLTRSIHAHSQRTVELDILLRNSDQWQKLNLAFIETPGLQRIFDAVPPISADEEDIRRNLLFYMLNTLQEIHAAMNAGLLQSNVAMRLMRGQTAMLKAHDPVVRALATPEHGYDLEFCAFVEGQLGPKKA